ncbi:MAG: hypothetical protein JW384_03851 [Nitrosomonadaceae bacterium]|nr:hypothetical protein [Nitrosomonadaceae bacterium]
MDADNPIKEQRLISYRSTYTAAPIIHLADAERLSRTLCGVKTGGFWMKVYASPTCQNCVDASQKTKRTYNTVR